MPERSPNRYEQILFFPQYFQKTCTAETKKTQGLFGKGLTYYQTTNFRPPN